MKKILFAIMLFVLSACAVTKPIEQARDSVRVEYRLDSVYIVKYDSVFRDRWRNGDTVFVVQEKWHTQWKDKTVQVHDTISVTNTQVVAEKYVPKFYKICTIGFFVFILLLIVRIIIKIYVKR